MIRANSFWLSASRSVSIEGLRPIPLEVEQVAARVALAPLVLDRYRYVTGEDPALRSQRQGLFLRGGWSGRWRGSGGGSQGFVGGGGLQGSRELLQFGEAGGVVLAPLLHGGFAGVGVVGAVLVLEGDLVAGELVAGGEEGFQLRRGIGRDLQGRGRHLRMPGLLLGDDFAEVCLPFEEVGIVLLELGVGLRVDHPGSPLSAQLVHLRVELGAVLQEFLQLRRGVRGNIGSRQWMRRDAGIPRWTRCGSLSRLTFKKGPLPQPITRTKKYSAQDERDDRPCPVWPKARLRCRRHKWCRGECQLEGGIQGSAGFCVNSED